MQFDEVDHSGLPTGLHGFTPELLDTSKSVLDVRGAAPERQPYPSHALSENHP